MKALVQRVNWSRVAVQGREVGSTEKGLLVLLGVAAGDAGSDASYLSEKTVNLRFFEDGAGKMNLSLKDSGGEAMVVSQFTLVAETGKGNRPGFRTAAPPDQAERLYEQYVEGLRAAGIRVQTGVFGAEMKVSLENDGPVTILLESK